MRVRMLATAAGPRGSFAAGQVVDLDDETAVAWLNAGYAEPVRMDVERAVVAPGTEAAVLMPDGGALTLIKGISQARADVLASIGITSIVDLAGADAVAVSGALKGVGQTQAQQWIADAIGMVG